MSEVLDHKSKKTFIWLIIIGVIAFGYLIFSLAQNFRLGQKDSLIVQLFKQKSESISAERGESEDLSSISEVAPSEKQIYTFEAETDNETPFGLLANQEIVDYDEYEAGVFITSINDQESNNDFYWALYINGDYAQKAADKIELEIGDLVEWRWEAIIHDFANEED